MRAACHRDTEQLKIAFFDFRMATGNLPFYFVLINVCVFSCLKCSHLGRCNSKALFNGSYFKLGCPWYFFVSFLYHGLLFINNAFQSNTKSPYLNSKFTTPLLQHELLRDKVARQKI